MSIILKVEFKNSIYFILFFVFYAIVHYMLYAAI